MKQTRPAAQSRSVAQFPAHSGKRQLGLFPKNIKTPAHGTDVVHSDVGAADDEGASDDDGANEDDGANDGVVDGHPTPKTALDSSNPKLPPPSCTKTLS